MKALLFFTLAISLNVHAANLLFKTDFKDAKIGPIVSIYPKGNGGFRLITGDVGAKFPWPPKGIGSNLAGVQYITVDGGLTKETLEKYIETGISDTKGPFGIPVKEIWQKVKIKSPVGGGGSQAPFLFQRPWTIPDIKDMYASYWFKFQDDLKDQLVNTVSAGNWRAVYEFKTGGYKNLYGGDYRITLLVMKDTKTSRLYWKLKGDNNANADLPIVDYWIDDNKIYPVPVGKWFKLEAYWHRAKDETGRFWVSVDGVKIFNHKGKNIGDFNLPVTRIFISNPYSGGKSPVWSNLTNLELWDTYPCGYEKSCYKQGKL